MNERERHEWGDAVYHTWRGGGNPDLLERNYFDHLRREGMYGDEIGEAEVNRQHQIEPKSEGERG